MNRDGWMGQLMQSYLNAGVFILRFNLLCSPYEDRFLLGYE